MKQYCEICSAERYVEETETSYECTVCGEAIDYVATGMHVEEVFYDSAD